MGKPSFNSYDVSLPDFAGMKSSHFVEHCAGVMPGGGCALPGLLRTVGPVSAAPPGNVKD
ncbi:hypothetical protein SS39_12090 [Enterobacter chengduensis]|nr:hypothetical protein SS39_12090 [Enterobacter chengduensis]PNL54600.1 hypothetical protein CEP65_018070 [Enterobacter hormaechei]PVU44409.1 hypothetical protein CP954_19115 [Enterobacter sp. PN108E5IIB]PVU54465.1 hypothetical protein CP955_03710 [Enterobacter sp. HN503E2II]KJM06198.1 hypothetical protein SS50_06990 [Enterobacter chengduensis]